MTDRQAGTDALAAATESLEALTAETQRVAAESFEEAMQVMERICAAQSLQEVVALQTSLIQSAAARYAAYTRKIAELTALRSTGMFGRF